MRIIVDMVGTGNVGTITIQDFLFNTVRPDPKDRLNFLVLMVKFYIYKAICLKEKPSEFAFKQELILIRNIEKYKKWHETIDNPVNASIGDSYINEYVDNLCY